MKKYRTKFVKILLGIGLTIVSVTACNEDKFLDVPRTDRLSADNYPNKVDDFNLLLNDLYGRLRNTMYLAFEFPHFAWGRGHETDFAHPDFLPFARLDILPSNGRVSGMWGNYYSNIARVNSYLDAVEEFIQANPNALPEIKRSMELQKGQALFIRAFNYFHLVTLFGETSVSEPGDLAKMGVPLFKSAAKNIEESKKGRSTIGELYSFIIEDLEQSAMILKGHEWPDSEKARVTEWGVKGLLGKVYLYSLDYTKAANNFKDIIDNSGKTLVPFDIYKDIFSAKNEFNSESIFELNFNDSKQGEWNNKEQTSHFLGIFISPAFLNGNRQYENQGFGNLFLHDKNLLRYGYDYPEVVDQSALQEDGTWKSDEEIGTILEDYLNHAESIRENKSVDPRLFVTSLQPYYDSVYISNTPRVVIKNRGEGPVLGNNYVWAVRKYAPIFKGVWSDGAAYFENNIYVIRLADVYLMYAEALINSGGSSSVALEYINKVKRRAYSLPVDAPAAIDYTSLTSETMASDPVLANNPLRYERWAEFLMEGHWFFDVGRWKIGAEEAAYYQKVSMGDNLTWNNRNYTLPIPESELNANPMMTGKQNPGYN